MGKVTGILLAGGNSSRFGTDKLCQLLAKHKTVAEQACLNLLAGTDEVVVVIRPGAVELAEVLNNTGAIVVECPDAEEGMGKTLAYGISIAPEAQGWVIALADMPWIQPITITKVADAIRHGTTSIAAPFWQGQRGHPVGFLHVYRDELLALGGDSGAKRLLQKNQPDIYRIDCDDPGILMDVDIPSDLNIKLQTAFIT